MKKNFWRCALSMVLILVGFVSTAFAEDKSEYQTLDLHLKVSEYTGNAGGTVAMSRFFISGDENPKLPDGEGQYHGTGWGATQDLHMTAEVRAMGKFNQVIIYAKPNAGYTFQYWADVDSKTNPSKASTKETTIHSGGLGYIKRQLCQNNPWASDFTKDGYFGSFFHFHVSGTFTKEHEFDYTLYAVFEPNEYTVTFNPGDGSSVTPTSKTVKFNTAYGILPTPAAKAGYTFAGWYNESEELVHAADKKTSAKDETLTAKWNEITYAIHFVDDEQGQTPKDTTYSVAVGAMPALPVATYRLSATDKYFAGYYTMPNGAGDRVYKGCDADNDGNLDLVAARTLAANLTLYAHYSHVHHNMYWDYTYMDYNSTTTPKPYVHMAHDNAQDRIQYARLTFFHANGTAFKNVILYTENPTNKNNTPTADFTTHTTALANIHLYVGESTVSGSVINKDTESGEHKVFFTDEELADFHSYTFEPIKNAKESEQYVVHTLWNAAIQKTTHNTILTFNGASEENSFKQEWSVNLSGLLINPDYIYVMPLYEDNNNWYAISQLAQSVGVSCAKVSDANGVATYNGSFIVWNEYDYAIGLVGFKLGGKDYWMNTTEPGTFADFYNSANYVGATTGITVAPGVNTLKNQNTTINMTVPASAIPVIRFMSNEGVLSSTTPSYLVAAYGATINLKNEQGEFIYSATREGYAFKGWAEEGQSIITSLTANRAFTLIAQWEGNKYDVSLLRNDGTAGAGAIVTATYGSAMPEITAPTRPGYTFKGYWDLNDVKYYDENAASVRNYDKMTDCSLYAGWEAKQTTVSFNLNGAEGTAPAAQTATYDVALTDLEDSDVPVWDDDHIFLGFFDAQEGGTMYMDETGHGVKLWDKEDATATLYAQWMDIRIILDANKDPNPMENYYYATCYYSDRNLRVDENTTIFKGVMNGYMVDFVAAEEDTIPAGQAVILQSTSNKITLRPVVVEEGDITTDYSDNDLRGVDVETAVSTLSTEWGLERIYTLAAEPVNNAYRMAFYHFVGETVAAHKAFLPIYTNAAPHRIDFVLPGTFNPNVTVVENAECKMQSAKCIMNGRLIIKRGEHMYDLNGRVF